MMFRTDWMWLVGLGLCWVTRLEVKRRGRKSPERCSQEPPPRRHKLPNLSRKPSHSNEMNSYSSQPWDSTESKDQNVRHVLFSWGSARLSSSATRRPNESWCNNCPHFSPRSHGWVGQRHSGISGFTWASFGEWGAFESLRDCVCSVCILKYLNYLKKFNIFRFSHAVLLHAFLLCFILILKSQWKKSPERSCWTTLLGGVHREEAQSHDRDVATTLLLLGSRELETSKVKTLSETLGDTNKMNNETLLNTIAPNNLREFLPSTQ